MHARYGFRLRSVLQFANLIRKEFPTIDPKVSKSTGSSKKFAVLIIDDSKTDRMIMARYLGQAWPFEHDLVIGYAVDGRDAIEQMRTTRFAMILLDWKLPGMGGGEVLRQIRRSGVHIPVIVLSGLEREAIEENLDNLGAAFLNKNEMNSSTFHDAIAASLKLMGMKSPSSASQPS